ncbi:hypothetical protein ACTXN4_28845, partial [Pseudomonas helleri]|uniref:hypothetical protein n=1 Tax=Pseudomonas helleri TaxID=1608996 RepID=UPI003FD3DC36
NVTMAKQYNSSKRGIGIKLVLPGVIQAVPNQPLADCYEVTVTRSDGVAPNDTEAYMILMRCFEGGALDHHTRSAKKQ